tara:strand:+ start:136 stop:573 length:438 start_codon:yes stop_codon:yes gene_type:complete
MNEVENQLAELIKKAIEVAEKTGEFAIEQAPLLLQEFYMWHIAKAFMFICVGIAVWIILRFISNLFGSKESFKWIRNKGYSFEEEEDSVLIQGKYYRKGSDNYIGAMIFKYAGLIIFSIIFFANLYKILFITIAPKLYLIEYFIR